VIALKKGDCRNYLKEKKRDDVRNQPPLCPFKANVKNVYYEYSEFSHTHTKKKK
jgi:hypothetical protein